METVSLTCSMGLHAMPDSSLRDASILKQSERRLFTAIYILDKTAAIFSGNTPLLTSHFCSTALPLDICNDALLNVEDYDTFDVDSRIVNDKGWNTDEEVYSTTSLRARGLIAQIREEILAVAQNQEQRTTVDLM